MRKGPGSLPGKWSIFIFVVVLAVTVTVWLAVAPTSDRPGTLGSADNGKEIRILYVDSYHPDYPPNVDARAGFEGALKGRNVAIRYVYLDAKRKKSAMQLANAAKKAKAIADSWKPDVIVAADDAASKYLAVPYYRNGKIPVIFIGVNWSASAYGFPCANVTGQIEVDLIKELIKELSKYAKGRRLALITGNTFTDKRNIDHYRTILGIKFDSVRLVEDFESWKEAYTELQSSADMVILRNNAGIADWSDQEAKAVVLSETRVPTGTVSTHLYPYSLIGLVKVNREFGEYAGNTALAIANGTQPSKIPITQNAQARTYLNMRIAKKLGIRFPMELIERAQLVSAEPKRVLYVNSYHPGQPWSDDLEKGLLKSLAIKRLPDGSLDASHSSIELKIIYMDTQRNPSKSFKKKAGNRAKAVIDSWKPDLIVVSDDVAAKYLIVPHCMTLETPVVFCGLNWSASEYGFPTETVTGVLEISPVRKTLKLLEQVAKGNRLGILGAKTETNEKEVARLKTMITCQPDAARLVSSFDEWKREYLWMQKNVDACLLLPPDGITSWNRAEAETFVLKRSTIPTGCFSKETVKLSLLGNVKIAEEQGWEAGRMGLEILEGSSPADLPVRANKGGALYLNMTLAKRMGIKFSVDQLKAANLVEYDTQPRTAK